jgi:hypothetical protein
LVFEIKKYLLFFLLKNYLFKSFFFNKKIEIIDKDLVLIGQIQRSGATLLSQLFDDHSELLNYPSELILTEPKYDWSKNLNFSTIEQNPALKQNIITQNYEKLSKGKIDHKTRNKFIFNPFIEKKIIKSIKTNDLRSNFNAYFTAFFNAFINYNNNKNNKKKFITAFLPRFIMIDENIDLFFQIYPNGKLINIIRDPRSWLISAKNHSRSYEDTVASLELWKKSCENSLKYKNKYKNKIFLIKFDDLIKNTEMTMRKICSKININFEESLLPPTFNGKLINSDSSFKSVTGKVDKSVLQTKTKNFILSNNDIKIIETYESWFQDFIKKIN